MIKRVPNLGLSLSLDTKKLLLGSELVTNGQFNTDLSGWTNSSWDTFLWDNGEMNIASLGTVGGQYCSQTITNMAAGFTYRCSLNVTKNGPGDTIRLDTGTPYVAAISMTASGKYFADVTPVGAGRIRIVGEGSTQDWNVDNVSIKRISTNDYGSEIAINGSFDTDTDWTKGTGWSISGGVASCDGSQIGNSDLLQNTLGAPIELVVGQLYRVSYTISNYTAGTLQALLIGTGNGKVRSANGNYVEDILASGGNANKPIIMRANVDFQGDIDNVSVKQIIS